MPSISLTVGVGTPYPELVGLDGRAVASVINNHINAAHGAAPAQQPEQARNVLSMTRTLLAVGCY